MGLRSILGPGTVTVVVKASLAAALQRKTDNWLVLFVVLFERCSGKVSQDVGKMMKTGEIGEEEKYV